MDNVPVYPPDAEIYRLLAGGPLPTAAIVDRLGMPRRTARHRLHQLRRAGVVATGDDGLHRLAGLAGPDLAGLAGPEIAGLAGEIYAGEAGERRTFIAVFVVLTVLAVVGFGLAAVAVARTIRPDPPPTPPLPYGYGASWYPGPAW
jgi:DNA-binding transcriptional ArsR family regulator